MKGISEAEVRAIDAVRAAYPRVGVFLNVNRTPWKYVIRDTSRRTGRGYVRVSAWRKSVGEAWLCAARHLRRKR